MHTEATISLFEAADGWGFKLVFDDGLEGFSEERFETKEEAMSALRDWTERLGIKTQTAQ